MVSTCFDSKFIPNSPGHCQSRGLWTSRTGAWGHEIFRVSLSNFLMIAGETTGLGDIILYLFYIA
jgi:hypothetical protein